MREHEIEIIDFCVEEERKLKEENLKLQFFENCREMIDIGLEALKEGILPIELLDLFKGLPLTESDWVQYMRGTLYLRTIQSQSERTGGERQRDGDGLRKNGTAQRKKKTGWGERGTESF